MPQRLNTDKKTVLRLGNRIFCELCPGEPVWCQHIFEIMHSGEDEGFIWKNPELPNLASEILSIPVFPSSNVWTDVSIRYVTKFSDQPRGEVWWERGFDPVERHFVGYLIPGEGRRVIRSLLIELMWANIDPRRHECKSNLHTVAAQTRWTLDMAERTSKAIQYWCVWTTSMCLTCRNTDAAILEQLANSGAIPDMQNSGVWNNK